MPELEAPTDFITMPRASEISDVSTGTLRTTLNQSVGRAYHEAKESGHITPQGRAAIAQVEDTPRQ